MTTEDGETTIEMRTRLQSSKVYFKWTIEKWDLTSYSQRQLKSQNFKLPELHKICFLTIDLNKSANNVTLLTVHLEVCEQLQKCVVSARIINNEGSKVELEKYVNTETTVEYKVKRFYELRYKIVEEYFADNTLVFVCQIDYVLENYKLEKMSNSFARIYKLYREKMVLNNFDKLYKNEQLYDITFVLGQHEFKAHSFILATISPYFLAMFNHDDMKESQERIINLTDDDDVTLENFKIFLNYLYGCTSVYENKEMVRQLLVLADKFDVSPLKIACESYLIDTITEENGAELLLFADNYNCNVLKREALDFAKAHLDIIKQSNVFKNICTNVNLMMQLI